VDSGTSVTAPGGSSVTLTGAGGSNITINGAIDPAAVTVTADDDIIINAPVTATDLIQLLAGQDGSGSVITNAGGTLTTTNAGSDIVLRAGTATGTITLGDDVSAVDEVMLTSQQGITQNAGALTAANLLLQGAGTFTLTQTGNDITTLAAN